MRPHHLSMLALSLAAVGCVDAPYGGLPDELEGPVAARSAVSDSACPEARMIAQVEDLDAVVCPELEGWAEEPLLGFTDTANGLLCEYTHDGSIDLVDAGAIMDAATQAHAVGGGEGGEVVAPLLAMAISDCVGILPQTNQPPQGPAPADPTMVQVETSRLADALGPDLRDIFRQQIGWVDPAAFPAGGAGVMVAVVDTMPTAGTQTPSSKHGDNMARLIDDLLCSGDPCEFEVVNVLGLPRTKNGVDELDGGYAGSFGDLARGIEAAVGYWQTNAPTKDLVINLSVGWEPSEFGADDPSNPRVQAVETALEYASCHGALIVASAGNDSGLGWDGALYPAQWETQAAPDAGRCAQLGDLDDLGNVPVPTEPVDPSLVYHPLVHAVGGLHVRPESMPGTRALATPRLVADATHVVAGTGNDLTTAYTGTSVSAAVVSAVAAAAWSRDPERNPWEVMQLVHDSGQAVGPNAEFHLDGHAAESVRRVGMCQAMDMAILDQSYPCTWAQAADLGPIVQAAANVDPTPVIVPAVFETVEACDCDPAVEECIMVHGPIPGAGNPGLCDETDFDPTSLYVSPQPNDPACPTCTLTEDETLEEAHVNASLDRFYDGMEIEWVSVEVSDGTVGHRFLFENVSLTPYDVTKLQLDPTVIENMGQIVKGSISVKFVEDGSMDDLEWPATNDLIIE